MNKRGYAIALCIAVSLSLTGCQRRMAPNPSNQGQPGNQTSRISAAQNRADYYDGVVTNKVAAKTGMNGTTPITYTVPNGGSVRIVGKYDGYYVAVLPNNQMGLVPISSVRPASQGTNGSTQNQPGTAAPTAPQSGTTAPTVPQGGTTGGRVTTPPATPQQATGNTVPSTEASTMINLVNQTRSQAGLSSLSANGSLANLANMKASDIVKNNYFSHTSPTYGSPFDMMKNNGVSYLYAGENLAINQNVQAAEQALMNSPQHKANIMNPNFTDIGVGIVQKSDGSRVYVQMFIGK